MIFVDRVELQKRYIRRVVNPSIPYGTKAVDGVGSMWVVAAELSDPTRTRRRRRSSVPGYAPSSPRHSYEIPGAPVPPAVVRGEGIEALTHDVLIRRNLEVSPNGFITIISIIQGVALALLAEKTFDKPSLLVAVQSVSLLLIFVSVFYWYLTLSVFIRWAPSFLDCLLPFAIAGLEIPPAFFLGDSRAWNLWLAMFWAGTAVGLWITKKWCPPSHFGPAREAYRMFIDLLRELQMIAGVGALALAFCGIFAYLDWTHKFFWGMAGALTVLTTVAFVVYRVEHGAARIHEHFGVSRPPFN
uniref:hypothetical protein n=1 Tax=Paractinoplanes polyasparticus TaxID=2856853 RepID=UPI001C861BA4|nr:hypothetical protein [Actinoplanes polyasparticus]